MPKNVITQLEPGLFKKVTGLSVEDFNMLCSLGVFNAPLMNDAIFKFKRYEDASLTYTGIDKHTADEVGGGTPPYAERNMKSCSTISNLQ